MKVLLVHNEYQQPGGEDIVFRQERQLLSRFGHTVLTYIRSNHEIRRCAGYQRLTLPRQLIWAGKARQDVARILGKEKPDIVHVHNTFTQISPSIYAACRDAGIPVVQTLHNFRLLCPAATFYRNGRVCEECVTHSLWRSVEHGCYRNSRLATAAVAMMLATHRRLRTWTDNIDAYVALTEFSRQKFIRQGFPAERIHVKPNFVDPDPGQDSEKGGYALFVGRLSDEKGLQTLLNAWTYVGKPVQLFIVGDGPLRSKLEEYTNACNLSTVSFLGRLKHEETQKTIKAARFLVLPSQCYENFPMTIAEAFASGTPVICSRLGAMQEIVEDGRTGLHFAANNSNDLAEKISWAWAHGEQMGAMGEEARREYETNYTAEKNHSLMMDIYQRAIGKPSPLDYSYHPREDLVHAIQP
jgi:glycosyltransferase involved in cell wall biosynthesis